MGHAERQAVVERLNAAFADGVLDVGELEERVTAAYAAKTVGQLKVLTADLPPDPSAGGGDLARSTSVAARPAAPATPEELKQALVDFATTKLSARTERERQRALRRQQRQQRLEQRHERWQRATLTSWATVSAVTFTIWLIVGLTSGFVYPWFLWVAGPWGAVLLAQRLTSRDQRR